MRIVERGQDLSLDITLLLRGKARCLERPGVGRLTGYLPWSRKTMFNLENEEAGSLKVGGSLFFTGDAA
jgi:hypothetical protein